MYVICLELQHVFPLCYLLQVEQDFRILFPELCDSLYMKWPGFCTKVIQYADRQLKWRPLLNLRGMTDGGE